MAGNLTAMIAAAFSGSAAPPVTSDPYYEYTTLLLPGNGTNGAQNNTFLDSSTNNFTITRNGNTTQGTFSPFSQTGWGNYFNGSSNLETPDAAALHLGTGDFTVEGWVYATTTSTTRPIYSHNNGNYELNIALNNGNNLVAAAYTSGGSLNFQITSSTTVSANSWFHFALVRSGSGSNNIVLYIDGVSRGTATYTGTMTNGAAGGYRIARDYSSVNFFTGYISNLRVVKGRAVYTSAFTPPTSPLGATSGGQNPPQGTETSLLTCQSNRFVDNSSNNFTLTTSGSPSVQAFSPFNPSASWSAATYGGSGYFDGNGDYLTVANNDALNLGNSDFTIEGWFFSSASFGGLFAKRGSNTVTGIAAYTDGTKIQYLCAIGGSWAVNMLGTANWVFNQWNHFAFVRSGSTFTSYINGVVSATATNSGTIDTNTGGFAIGATAADGAGSATSPFYLGSMRVVKGTAVYTSAFTPPTAPLTAITNTSLLLNYTNAGIYDATSKNDLETVGNAQISTTQSKWGGSSMVFNGSTSYLLAPASNLFDLGSVDWTVEGWFYMSATGSYPAVWTLGNSNGDSHNLLCNGGTRDLYYFINGGATAVLVTTISLSQWYHFAVVRSSGTTKIYLNGTQTGGTTANAPTSNNKKAQIGGTDYGSQYWNGYIQDVRITKGYARYTANFTAPTAAFPTL